MRTPERNTSLHTSNDGDDGGDDVKAIHIYSPGLYRVNEHKPKLLSFGYTVNTLSIKKCMLHEMVGFSCTLGFNQHSPQCVCISRMRKRVVLPETKAVQC